MNKYWLLETLGDPLSTLRRIVLAIWGQASFDRMYLPIKSSKSPYLNTELVEDRTKVKEFNPFIPLLLSNGASTAPEMLEKHKGEWIGLFLRPCEVRSLKKLKLINGIDLERVITISVDCLGTYPLDDFKWRLKGKLSKENIKRDGWKFARQGGILKSRKRLACQICEGSLSEEADICIGIIGLPVRKHVVIKTSEKANEVVSFDEIFGTEALPDLIEQRESMAQKVNFRQNNLAEQAIQNSETNLPRNMKKLSELMNECGDCQICQQVCPFLAAMAYKKKSTSLTDMESLKTRMKTCSGCGMCEEYCVRNISLPLIFSYLRRVERAPSV